MPILVSIGYATCHWCHVMERESFENEEVAAFMNAHFICIKVDREERPDVDQIYMEACQIISGSGGWPLNCFLLPDGRPFFAGTYYPPQPAYNRPSWVQVLQNLSDAFRNKREVVEEQASRLMEIIEGSGTSLVSKKIGDLGKTSPFPKAALQTIFQNLKEQFDTKNGGFGNAPKFPGTMSLHYLLNYHYFTGEDEALRHVLLSLDKMIMGGLYDQIGGGFSRYSTDATWLVPHFEKMLYDNALLVNLLSEAYKLTKKELYKESIEETLAFIAREMTSAEGGFYAALDADSEGVEGKYHVWDINEIRTILGESLAGDYCAFYGVSPEGNWEGKNILHRKHTFEEFVKMRGQGSVVDFKKKIKESSKKLLAAKAKRVRPALDDKILLGWNALQCSAYANAYAALQKESYKKAAVRNLEFLLEKFAQPGGLEFFHTCKNGQTQYTAFLDDYAYLIEAALDVYEITFDTAFIVQAGRLTELVLANFLDKEDKLFYFTSSNQKDLISRRKGLYDSAIPSGNSTMVCNLQRLGIILNGGEDYKKLAAEMLLKLRDAIQQHPSSFSKWAIGLMNETYSINEIAVVGKEALEKAKAINETFLPNKVVMASTISMQNYPLLKGKKEQPNTFIYLCKNHACRQPVTTIEALSQLLNKNEV